MSETTHAKGRCLCGAVEIEAKTVNPRMHACHCGMCRKWGSGGPFLALSCGADIAFEGEENISVYESSAWAERGFCGKCGTHLFYRIKETMNYEVPVGVFDDISGITFEQQICIDRKPDYYDFADRTTKLTEAETFAMFASQQEEQNS